MSVPNFKSNAEKAKYYKELKRKKKSEKNRKYYIKNNSNTRQTKALSDSHSAVMKRNQR